MATALSGDQQVGRPTEQLSAPVRLRVVDADGHPLIGATVEWSTGDGGSIEPPQSLTDADGVATAQWTLGPAAGAQTAHARVGSEFLIAFTATATTNDGSDISLLSLSTYETSGESVHPDYVAVPTPWAGASRYLVLTPYPNGNANFENPSLYTATNDVEWSAPAGVANPIVTPTRGYLSDPDAVYVPEHNELWVYYRSVDAENQIDVVRSSDGVRFGAPTLVAHAANHNIVSPTVVHRSANDWLMWSVNSNAGCTAQSTSVELRRSTNGLDWSAPENVDLTQVGFSPWHIDVQWIASRNEFWAIYNGKLSGSCTTPALFLATSGDGVHWKTFPSPLLARGVVREFQDVVYRSTFTFDPAADAISFWYSGARYDSGRYIWKSAFQKRSRSDVFAAVQRSTSAIVARTLSTARRDIPPLLDAP
jgi:hypothetical protein